MRYRAQTSEGSPTYVSERFLSRASQATFVNPDLRVSLVGPNVARYQNGVLLLESERENLARNSQNFASIWGRARTVVVPADTASPQSGVLADKLREDSTPASTHFMNQTFTFQAGRDYTFSIMTKMAGRTSFRLSLPGTVFHPTGAATPSVLYFLDTMTTQIGPGGGAAHVLRQSLTPLADGWARCRISGRAYITSTTTASLSLMNAVNNITYDGDGVSGVYVWGGQMEDGLDMSSYIPTGTTTALRAADIFDPAFTVENVAGDYNFIGNSAFLRDTPEAVAQAIKTRLKLVAGEWFLDSRVGFDLSRVLGNNTQATRDFEVKRVIGGTEGVTEIVAYFSQVDAQRRFTVNAVVDTRYGRTSITETFR